MTVMHMDPRLIWQILNADDYLAGRFLKPTSLELESVNDGAQLPGYHGRNCDRSK